MTGDPAKGEACRVCGGPAMEQPWGGRVCDRCQSVSAASLPSDEELAAFYRQFNAEYLGGTRNPNRARNNQLAYARAYLQVVKGRRSTGALLDVGPSTNPFPNLARRAGFDVTVCDLVRPHGLDPEIAFVEGRVDDDAGPLARMGPRFDVVTAFAVLEHCRRPRTALSVMASLCRQGGAVVLSTPLVGSVLDRLAAGRNPWFHPPAHLHLLSRRGLEVAGAESGLRLDRYGWFEVSWPRWLARYGIGGVEGALGLSLRLLSRSLWERVRRRRVSPFKGIALVVFEKAGNR